MEEIVEGWRARTGLRWRGKKMGGWRVRTRTRWRSCGNVKTGKLGGLGGHHVHHGMRALELECSKQSKAIYESTYTSSRRSP
jgi:hypothetical protein